MNRLTWTQTRDSWRSGRYQIELAAPQLWVLSRLPRRTEWHPIQPATILRTGGSLTELKRSADALETRRAKSRHLVAHLVVAAIFSVVSALLADSPLFIPVTAALFAVALHTVVVWVDLATGSAWTRLSDVYQ